MSKKAKVRSLGKKVVKRRKSVAPAVLAVAVLAVSVFIFHKVLTRSIAPPPTLATIAFYSGGPSRGPKNATFTVNVQNAQAAAALINETRKLPSMPVGAANCPSNDGSFYKMTFKDPTVTVLAHTTGCRDVIYSSSQDLYRADAGFWKTVHQATGKPVYPGSKATYF